MADSQNMALPVAGLITDPGPFSGAPPGSLIQAQNVAFRRLGTIEPRAKFVATTDSGIAADSTCAFVCNSFDGAGNSAYWIGSYESGPTTVWQIRRDNSATVTPQVTTTFTRSTCNSETMQGRLFLTANEGVTVIDANTSSTAHLAGLPRASAPLIQINNSSGGLHQWLTNDSATSYRVCFARNVTTATGAQQLLVGAPSDAVIQRQKLAAAANCYTWLFLYLPPEIKAGDFVQFYRSYKVTPSTATPADEFRLRNTLTVTNFDVSNGYVQFIDALADTEYSGPSLYTNESEDGAALANYRPYYARDCKSYNGMMFYAGQRSPQRVTATLKATGYNGGADFSQTLCSIKLVMVAGIIPAGSTVLPYNTPSFTGQERSSLAVGQIVTKTVGGVPGVADSYFSANTKVVSIGSGTITVDKPTLTNIPASEVLTFWDWINVNYNGSDYKIYANSSTLGGSITGMNTFLPTAHPEVFGVEDENGSTGITIAYPGGAPDMERAWMQKNAASGVRLYAFEDGSGAFQGITLTFEAETVSDSNMFVVTCTKPGAFDKYIDTATGVTSERDGYPGRLAWSKLDQPDSVPLPYYADVGDRNQPIYRIQSTQDAVYVFKGDGIFRLYGRTPDNLTIDPIDPTARISAFAPQWVVKYGDRVFAWTTRGVVEVGSFGVRNIDEAVHQYITSIVTNSVNVTGAFSCASSYNRFILFGYKQSANASALTYQAILYFPELDLWATWTVPFGITAAGNGFQSDTVFGHPTGTALYVDDESEIRDPSRTAPSYDTNGAQITMDFIVSGTTVGYSPFAGSWTPSVGDAIAVPGGGTYYVQGTGGPAEIVLDRVPEPADLGPPSDVRLAFQLLAQWVARDEGNPQVNKRWENFTQTFDRLRGGFGYLVFFNGYQNNTYGLVSVTYDPTTHTDFAPFIHRSHVPTTVARDWAIKPGIMAQQAGFWFTTSGVGVEFNYVGSRPGGPV